MPDRHQKLRERFRSSQPGRFQLKPDSANLKSPRNVAHRSWRCPARDGRASISLTDLGRLGTSALFSTGGCNMATNRALLVAINNYGSQQNNLPSCLEDAARFRSLLEERYGFDQFTELYDGDATVANVEQGLTWLFEDVAPDDRLVFFYSGHGYQQPNGENLEECLVLSNMEFLFDDRLSELSQTAPPGVLTVVFDSCFSGGMEKQVGADGRIEIARTKAWSPPANARSQQQKALIGRQLIPRPFGSMEVTDPAGVKALVLGRGSAPSKAGAGGAGQGAGQGAAGGADETGELALNGLLLSACSENETASAATSATDGMSAFTCALMNVFDAAQAEL
jgi:hypothetical protein